MEFKFGLTLAVVLALITKGHSQLQCYVCENCAKIDKNTPLQMCGPDTGMTTTMMPPADTTTPKTTTMMSTSEATSTPTTAATMTSSTTSQPTPPTIGPSSSTTSMPTPPNVGPVMLMDMNGTEMHMNHTAYVDATSLHHLATPPTLFVTPSAPFVTVTPTVLIPTEGLDISNSTSNTTIPTTFLIRQRRDVPDNGTTWHCYRVQKKYDNMYGIQRGCMGVTTEQSVCAMLKAANSNQTHKCRPCTTSMCNGNTAIEVSIVTMLVALVALIYKV